MPTSKARRRRLKAKERQRTRYLQQKAVLPKSSMHSLIHGSIADVALRSEDDIEKEDENVTTRYDQLDLSSWTCVRSANWSQRVFRGELPNIRALCRLCNKSLFLMLYAVQSFLFPSLAYRKELRAMTEKLHELEAQIIKLADKQASLSKVKPSNDVSHSMCCAKCSTLATNNAESAVGSTVVAPQVTLCGAPTSGMIPPAPPPPPPPPPLPSLSKKSTLQISKKSLKLPLKEKPTISLQDIRNVKLRKMQSTFKAVNTMATVTEADLKQVHLKSTKTDVLVDMGNKDLRRKLVHEVANFHHNLRKIDMNRSPGGTPIVDRSKIAETGTGVTPMMTRALRKRFLLLHTPSPIKSGSDDEDQENFSPFCSP